MIRGADSRSARRFSGAAQFESQPRKMHRDSSSPWVFARDRDALAACGVEIAFDRIDAGVGRRDHHLLALGDAMCIGGNASRVRRSRLTGDSDRGAAIELTMRAVTERVHAFAPGRDLTEGLEDLRHRTASENEPEAVIEGEIGNGGLRAEEKSLIAEHLFQALEVQTKRGTCLRDTHPRYIRAKGVAVFSKRLDDFGRRTAEHVRETGGLQGVGDRGPEKR